MARGWWQFGSKPARVSEVDLSAGNRHVRMNTSWKVLASCEWISDAQNLLIVGPGGLGKTFVASALFHEASTLGHSTVYSEIQEISKAVALRKSSRQQTWCKLGRADLLVLDEFSASTMTQADQGALSRLLELRVQRKSTVLVSRTPICEWQSCCPDLISQLERFLLECYWVELQSRGCTSRQKL